MGKASSVFNLKDDPRGIARVPGPGLKTNIFPGEQVMLSVVRIEPNAAGTRHSHPGEYKKAGSGCGAAALQT